MKSEESVVVKGGVWMTDGDEIPRYQGLSETSWSETCNAHWGRLGEAGQVCKVRLCRVRPRVVIHDTCHD